jgi:CheY-like chemotaxis protein
MHHRYVLKLTQEETAQLINISVRHLNRVQREAVRTLARYLWERYRARDQLEGTHTVWDRLPSSEEGTSEPALDWRSQTKHELASLKASAPDAVSNVEEVINSVLELESALASKHGARVVAGFVQPDLIAAIHPSVLRQMLITTVGSLARYTSTKEITIYAGLEDGDVKITATSPVAAGEGLRESELTQDILTPEDVSVEACIDGNHVFLWAKVPPVGKVTVLVVEDNPDMVHFYRRATTGTRYRIVHATQDVFETIKASAPDIVVLDVMLPDIDGWKLLMRLHEDPATRSIPIIICSVVREEGLALSLGAALHLSKPVRPREFIQALEQVLARAAAEASRVPARNATAC